MDKIIESFKNLYKGENVVKQHIYIALLFYLPCLASTILQFLDKDSKKEEVIIILVSAVIVGLLSIVPVFVLQGLWAKFINRRFSEAYGIPKLSWDCLSQGLKMFPLTLVWGLYIGIPCLLYLALVFIGFGLTISSQDTVIAISQPVIVIFAVLGLLLAVMLLFIPLFLISPFVNMVFMKYCEKFEYSKELFNPLLPFRYMKKAFKDSIFLALKFILVGMVTGMGAQIILCLLLMVLAIIAIPVVIILAMVNEHMFDSSVWAIPVVMLVSVVAIIPAYVRWITNLAYVDNLEEIYVDKFLIEE